VFHSSVFPKLLNASDFGFRDFVFTNTAQRINTAHGEMGESLR